VTNYTYAAGPWNVRSEAGFRHSHIVMETAVRHSQVVVESETDSHRCDAGWRLAARLSCGFINCQLVVENRADPDSCPIQNILIVGRSCDMLALNKFWTRPCVAVQKDLRVSDKIQENMRVPDG
jgi:hypothetical protein